MNITIGRTVLYVLNAYDAEEINNRRLCSPVLINPLSGQPKGNAIIGNQAEEGQIYPAVAVRIFGEPKVAAVPGSDADKDERPVNLKVLLDGNDDHWATSRHEDANKTPGTWHWPARA